MNICPVCEAEYPDGYAYCPADGHELVDEWEWEEDERQQEADMWADVLMDQRAMERREHDATA